MATIRESSGGTGAGMDDEVGTRDEVASIGPEGYSETTRLPALSRLRGMDVCAEDGERIGKVKDVFLDAEARHVRYLSISTGWLSGSSVVPVDDVTFVDDGRDDPYVVVPYGVEQIRNAPALAEGDEVTAEDERAVYEHYRREGYWDEARDIVRARQTPPAPTPLIAEAEVADAARRGDDPAGVRVKRWGV